MNREGKERGKKKKSSDTQIFHLFFGLTCFYEVGKTMNAK